MNSTNIASDAGSSGAAAFTAGAAGLATEASPGFVAGTAGFGGAEDATGFEGAGGSGVGDAGSGFSGADAAGTSALFAAVSTPTGAELLGADADGDTLSIGATGSDTVSAGFGSGEAAAFAAEAGGATSEDTFAGATGAADETTADPVTGAAVNVEPLADFGRAVGVLSSPFVAAITPDVVTAAFAAAAGAGAPGSAFFGGAGLNESRIFSAATHNCDRI